MHIWFIYPHWIHLQSGFGDAMRRAINAVTNSHEMKSAWRLTIFHWLPLLIIIFRWNKKNHFPHFDVINEPIVLPMINSRELAKFLEVSIVAALREHSRLHAQLSRWGNNFRFDLIRWCSFSISNLNTFESISPSPPLINRRQSAYFINSRRTLCWW